MRPSAIPGFLLLLLLLLAQPVQAGITFGVAPGSDGAHRSEKEVRALADYLAGELSEEVRIQTFSNEKTLHEWLNRYRMIDLAILSDSYLAGQLPGEFFPLTDLSLPQSPQTRTADRIIARQGLHPWLLRRLQKVLGSLADRPAGVEILKKLAGMAPAVSLPATEAAGVSPAGVTPTRPNPLPPTTPTAKKHPPKPQTMASDTSDSLPPPPAAEPFPNKPPPPAQRSEPVRTASILSAPESEGTMTRTTSGFQSSYRVEQVTDGIYAAIANPGSQATSNAFFVVGPEYVIAGGAHMTKVVIDDLMTIIRSITDKPLRHFILTHHHPGDSQVDFDFPPGIDLFVTLSTWKGLKDETRELDRLVFLYNDGMTLSLGDRTIVLSNMGRAHTEGDVVVLFPEEQILFTSDLVYVNAVGYMGDGYMEDWLLTLGFIEGLGAKTIIPGFGPVSSTDAVVAFKNFFREMMTEILRHLERGDSLEQTLQTLSLPSYGAYSGYDQFIGANVRRAYLDLQANIVN